MPIKIDDLRKPKLKAAMAAVEARKAAVAVGGAVPVVPAEGMAPFETVSELLNIPGKVVSGNLFSYCSEGATELERNERVRQVWSLTNPSVPSEDKVKLLSKMGLPGVNADALKVAVDCLSATVLSFAILENDSAKAQILVKLKANPKASAAAITQLAAKPTNFMEFYAAATDMGFGDVVGFDHVAAFSKMHADSLVDATQGQYLTNAINDEAKKFIDAQKKYSAAETKVTEARRSKAAAEESVNGAKELVKRKKAENAPAADIALAEGVLSDAKQAFNDAKHDEKLMEVINASKAVKAALDNAKNECVAASTELSKILTSLKNPFVQMAPGAAIFDGIPQALGVEADARVIRARTGVNDAKVALDATQAPAALGAPAVSQADIDAARAAVTNAETELATARANAKNNLTPAANTTWSPQKIKEIRNKQFAHRLFPDNDIARDIFSQGADREGLLSFRIRPFSELQAALAEVENAGGDEIGIDDARDGAMRLYALQLAIMFYDLIPGEDKNKKTDIDTLSKQLYAYLLTEDGAVFREQMAKANSHNEFRDALKLATNKISDGRFLVGDPSASASAVQMLLNIKLIENNFADHAFANELLAQRSFRNKLKDVSPDVVKNIFSDNEATTKAALDAMPVSLAPDELTKLNDANKAYAKADGVWSAPLVALLRARKVEAKDINVDVLNAALKDAVDDAALFAVLNVPGLNLTDPDKKKITQHRERVVGFINLLSETDASKKSKVAALHHHFVKLPSDAFPDPALDRAAVDALEKEFIKIVNTASTHAEALDKFNAHLKTLKFKTPMSKEQFNGIIEKYSATLSDAERRKLLVDKLGTLEEVEAAAKRVDQLTPEKDVHIKDKRLRDVIYSRVPVIDDDRSRFQKFFPVKLGGKVKPEQPMLLDQLDVWLGEFHGGADRMEIIRAARIAQQVNAFKQYASEEKAKVEGNYKELVRLRGSLRALYPNPEELNAAAVSQYPGDAAKQEEFKLAVDVLDEDLHKHIKRYENDLLRLDEVLRRLQTLNTMINNTRFASKKYDGAVGTVLLNVFAVTTTTYTPGGAQTLDDFIKEKFGDSVGTGAVALSSDPLLNAYQRAVGDNVAVHVITHTGEYKDIKETEHQCAVLERVNASGHRTFELGPVANPRLAGILQVHQALFAISALVTNQRASFQVVDGALVPSPNPPKLTITGPLEHQRALYAAAIAMGFKSDDISVLESVKTDKATDEFVQYAKEVAEKVGLREPRTYKGLATTGRRMLDPLFRGVSAEGEALSKKVAQEMMKLSAAQGKVDLPEPVDPNTHGPSTRAS